MPPTKPISFYVEMAEKIAAEHGGLLPSGPVLVGMGEGRLVNKIQEDRGPFEHLIATHKGGVDKEKYAVVSANMGLPDQELMDLAGISFTTLNRWKKRIREEQGMEEPGIAPLDASMAEVAAFIKAKLPPDWQLNIEWIQGECFVGLVQPNGRIPKLRGGEDLGVVQSVLSHVNHARRKAGLQPAEWGTN